MDGGIVEWLRAATLCRHLLYVNLRHQQPILKAMLHQQRTIFANQLMRAEYQIGTGFALTGTGIDIATQQFGRLHGYQLAAILALANHIVTGGQVADDGCTGLCQCHRGRDRSPQVLTNLKAQHQLRQFHTGKYQSTKGDSLSTEGHDAVVFGGRGKLPLFLKLAVIGQCGFRYHTQNFSLLYNHSAIIQLIPDSHGHSHGSHNLQITGGFQDRGHRLFCTP